MYIKQWKILNSRKTGHYVVSQRKDGGFECGCPAWTLNRLRPDCKHILEVKLALLTKENKSKPVKSVSLKVPIVGTRKLGF
jgi:predicted nucleic acid-binding Zn finger protein